MKLFFTSFTLVHFSMLWEACDHGVARPRFVDGGDGLQIRTVDANILNKQSRTANKG